MASVKVEQLTTTYQEMTMSSIEKWFEWQSC